jgi:hypothetical protein
MQESFASPLPGERPRSTVLPKLLRHRQENHHAVD